MKVEDLTSRILEKRNETVDNRAVLVGISGIDASGKGFVSRKVSDNLSAMGFNVALINADEWLNLPHVRFVPDAPTKRGPGVHRLNAGLHFYKHALRLDEMFDRLVIPLRRSRRVKHTMKYASETDLVFHQRRYEYREVDVILLEGIFIFKRAFEQLFDLKIWIECRFETALGRAVGRRQESLSSIETIDAYQKVYFPAQQIHLELDDPKATADVIFPND